MYSVEALRSRGIKARYQNWVYRALGYTLSEKVRRELDARLIDEGGLTLNSSCLWDELYWNELHPDTHGTRIRDVVLQG